PATIRRELEQLDRTYFSQKLASRGVFTQAKIKQLADTMEAVRREILYVVSAAEEEEKAIEIRDKVEDYLRFTPKQNLTVGAIEQNFKPLLQDADISFEQLQNRLKQFDRPTLLEILSTRQDLTENEAESILLSLENSRNLVLNESQELQEKANAQLVAVRQKLESYLRSTGKAELNPEGIKRDLQTLLNDPQAGMWALRARFSNFDRDTLVQLLSQRPDLSEDEVNNIIDRIESSWNNVVYAPKAVADQAKQQYDNITSAIADYLRNTGKNELNPEGIQRDLTKLLTDPKTGALSLRDRLSQVDRDTLVKLLSQREDISETQVNEIIDSVQDTIANIIRAPRRVAKRVQQQVRDFQGTLYDYLRSTGKDELNPEAIKRDLQLLLHDPSVGAQSLGERLSHFDRSTFVALLSQREDISEQEANRIADQIFAVRDSVVMQIQKVQDRVKSVIDGILGRIRDYLNSLDRPELNYEGIRRDVRKLFYDPQAGFDSLRDRLSHFNRDTLVAIMSSREDISEADANRIIDQIEGARTNVLQRAEGLQRSAQQRLEDLKIQAQKSAEETRKAAESAAWWLFFTALTSAIAGAGAGFLAVL
ncbi:MAG TPA: MFS transporter, partial [Halomicronema sp.]